MGEIKFASNVSRESENVVHPINELNIFSGHENSKKRQDLRDLLQIVK